MPYEEIAFHCEGPWPETCKAHSSERAKSAPAHVVARQQGGNAACVCEGMLPTHDVDCPRCGRFLYTALSLEDFFPADAPTSPRVLSDAQGDYLPCPHCGERVAMKRVTTNAGAGFRIAKSA